MPHAELLTAGIAATGAAFFGMRQPKAAASWFLLAFLGLVTWHHGWIALLICVATFIGVAALAALTTRFNMALTPKGGA